MSPLRLVLVILALGAFILGYGYKNASSEIPFPHNRGNPDSAISIFIQDGAIQAEVGKPLSDGRHLVAIENAGAFPWDAHLLAWKEIAGFIVLGDPIGFINLPFFSKDRAICIDAENPQRTVANVRYQNRDFYRLICPKLLGRGISKAQPGAMGRNEFLTRQFKLFEAEISATSRMFSAKLRIDSRVPGELCCKSSGNQGADTYSNAEPRCDGLTKRIARLIFRSFSRYGIAGFVGVICALTSLWGVCAYNIAVGFMDDKRGWGWWIIPVIGTWALMMFAMCFGVTA